MSTFATSNFAGDAIPMEGDGDPELGLGESKTICSGVDPEEGEEFLDYPRRRNEERDPDKAFSVSCSEASNNSVSEREGSLDGSF